MRVDKLTIQDVCEFSGGSQPPKSVFEFEPKQGYVRLIQTRDYKTDAFQTFVPENLARKFCDTKDIMIGRYGPPVFQILRGLKGAYNVALLKAIPKSNIDREYLYYFLAQDSVFKYVDSLSLRTGGQTGVDLVSLNKYPIFLPSLIIQKEIAAVLSSLDAKIELNNRINTQLEEMAKTLYDYWFVQFDFPNKDGKPYKSSGGKMVYNEVLKREIPEGWEVKNLGQVLKIVRGASPRPIDDFLSVEGLPWIKISDATSSDNRFIFSTKQYIKEEGLPYTRCIMPNTLILSNSATPALPRIVKIKAGVHDGWLVILEYSKGLTPEFMYHYFEYERPRILCFGNGSIFKNLKTDYIKDIKIALPSKAILDNANTKFKVISESIYINTKKNQQLTQLRDWLLPMLMNGQVRIKD